MFRHCPSTDRLAFCLLLLGALSVSSSGGVATDIASAQPDAGADGGAVAGGAGTAASPFQISWCEELQAIEDDLGANYVLTQHIDCTGFDVGDGKGFRPIGDNPNPFTGSLDGAGHFVAGLVIDRPSDDWVGLFGVTLGALVTRIGLSGVSIEGRQRVGGLVGWQREGVIEESFVTGTVTGEQYVGGIAGRTQDGSILNSYAQVSLSCTKWDSSAKKTNADCGGIIGGVVQGVTYNSYGAGAFASQHGATGGGGPETLVASFFDCELTGGCDNTHPEGRPTATLQDPLFYESEGWDFDNTWGFSAQTVHPCLQWQPTCSGRPGCGSDDPSCDGIDDDCDGAIDEDFPSAPTSCGVGACAATGVTSCDDGQVVDSCTPGTPASDDTTCDAVDDDCDEATDEDFVSVTTSCGVGACAGTGATSCIDGEVEDSCVAGSAAADDVTCDGGDDDCDDVIDEDYAPQPTSCGVGACTATGVTSCVGGTEEDSCIPGTPATEDVTCDGIDDNCDGTADSDFMPSSTTCGVGACAATGTETCVDGQVQDDCAPGTPASDDATCDAIDDDCDSTIDEDFPSQSTTCGVGACAATGATSCVGGIEQDSCVPGVPGSGDACDGIDEDCDGLVDEDHVLVPTACGIGACASVGVLSCVNGLIVDTCSAGTPTPDDATCDGIDDDCDGELDEDCCIPATCVDYNIDCGTVDDGCGAPLDCGTCQGDETCGGGGVPNVCGVPLPPDPEIVLPPAPAGAGSFLSSFSFLTEGPDPVQTGVAPGALEPERAALLRGRVLTRTGAPLPGVEVSVLDDASLGNTLSRADGRYDLLVNGGGLVTLRYDAVGYLPVQRTVEVPWSNGVVFDDVVMTVPASAATVNDVSQPVLFGASAPTQVAKGQSYLNDDGIGSHQVVGFFPSGVEAFAEVSGQSTSVPNGTLRMTEYSVGDEGPLAMPAKLPENSLYTFAVDLSLEELGPEAKVTFNQTTYFYVDDFLDSPVGTFVPNGYYDYDLARWVPEKDGMVMRVVSVTPGGLAEIDVLFDGLDTPADPVELETRIGLTAEEREVIAELYGDGRKFWRMPIDHLTPWDWNHNGILLTPPPADPPPDELLATGCQPPPPHETADGSILNCPSRSLAEEIPIAGTSLSLRYDSDRAKINTATGRTATIKFPAEFPSTAVSLVLNARVLGRTVADVTLPIPLPPPYDQDPSYTVTWDGLDAYGRPWAGFADLEYSITYDFTPQYQAFLAGNLTVIDAEESFGGATCVPGTPCCVSGSGGRAVASFPGRIATQSSLGFRRRIPLGAEGVGPFGFGGWSLDQYHYYDARTPALIRGDGHEVNDGGLTSLGVIAGRQSDGQIGQIPTLDDIFAPTQIAVGPDGSVYFSSPEVTQPIWRISRDGQIDKVVDNVTLGYSCTDVSDLAVDDRGVLYAACANPTGRIVQLTPETDGSWTSEQLVGLINTGAVWQDGDPLLGRKLAPQSVAVRDDGTLFFTITESSGVNHDDDPNSFRTFLVEYLPDGRGRIVDIVVNPRIAAGPDNTLVTYANDPTQPNSGLFSPGHLLQIFPDGAVSVLSEAVAPGGAQKTPVGFEWESADTHYPARIYNEFLDLTASADGDVFLTFRQQCFQRGQELFQVSREGQIRKVAILGVPAPAFGLSTCVTDSLARSESEAMPQSLAAGPAGRVFVTDPSIHRIYALGGGDPTGDGETFEVVSKDGSEIYTFSGSGLHTATLDAQTGAELLRFTHDPEGRLDSITDRDGRITDIRRIDNTTIEIAAPGGPGGSAIESVTTLKLDPNGFLSEAQNPRGGTWSFDYDSPDLSIAGEGLLQQAWDPRGNEGGLRSGQPYVFQYERFVDSSGATTAIAPWLLKPDTDPVGGSQTLTASVSQSPPIPIHARWCDGTEYVKGYFNSSTTTEVTRTTTLGRATRYSTTMRHDFPFRIFRTGIRAKQVSTTTTRPSGWYIKRSDPNNRNQGFVLWEGGLLSYALGNHERLGQTVLVPRDSTLTYLEQGTQGAEDYRPELKQDTTQTWTSAFPDSSGFPLPTLERTETTVTPANPASGLPRTSAVEYVSTPQPTVTATSPEGRVSSYVLDNQSRIVRLDLPGQVPTVYAYDGEGFLNQVIRIKGTDTRVTTFGYDTRGYVDSVENKVSDTVTDEVTMVNDTMGFATQTTVPGLLTVGSSPDVAGALSSLTPDGKPAHQLSYTPLGQLSQYASPAGTLSNDGSCPSGTQCWDYSLDRELEDITLPDGTVVDYVYEPVKATLTSVDVPGHGLTTFGYDNVGRRVSAWAPTQDTGVPAMTFAWQSTLPIRTTWSGAHTVPGVPGTVSLNGTVERFYNDFLEVSELHVTGGASVKLLRDKDGLVTDIADVNAVFPTLALSRSAIDGHVQGTTLDTVTTTHTLDVSDTTPGFGDLLAVSADAGATDLYDASYTYDDRGRIETWTESVEGSASVTRKFGYDAAGRLLTVHDISGGAPGTLLEEYQYDGNGNRQKAVSTYPGAVPLNAELGTNIGCPDATGTAANGQDQLCQYGDYDYAYNLRGQLESRSDGGVTRQYSYDGLGRLKQVSEPGMDIHYVHDALGRRIGKLRDGNLEKGWLYADALNPIAQLDNNGNTEATFVYGTRAHVPDAMVMTNGTAYRLITDHLGSVRLVVDAATGAVAQRIDYDAFGRVLNDTSPGFQPFGFAGGLYDDDTGLTEFGTRNYDPYTGRWTTKDLVLVNGGTPNFYEYAWNDPLHFVDVDGTIPIAIWGIAAALLFLESDATFSGADLLAVTGIPGCGKLLGKVLGRAAPKVAGVAEVLAPGGVRIGQAGANASLRIVRGGADDAAKLFQQLAAEGTEYSVGSYPGTLVRLPNGGTVGLRKTAAATGSRARPAATIDVNVPGVAVRELKFVP